MQLSHMLMRYRVDHVVPLEQLLQQGTDWQIRHQPRFAIPPQSQWLNIVHTLILLDRFIVPAIGPVNVVSGFRTPVYNRLAGGAARSKHLEFSALDLIPKRKISRKRLHHNLLEVWNRHGHRFDMGLGIYQGYRFHIDSGGYRKWRG